MHTMNNQCDTFRHVAAEERRKYMWARGGQGAKRTDQEVRSGRSARKKTSGNKAPRQKKTSTWHSKRTTRERKPLNSTSCMDTQCPRHCVTGDPARASCLFSFVSSRQIMVRFFFLSFFFFFRLARFIRRIKQQRLV